MNPTYSVIDDLTTLFAATLNKTNVKVTSALSPYQVPNKASAFVAADTTGGAVQINLPLVPQTNQEVTIRWRGWASVGPVAPTIVAEGGAELEPFTAGTSSNALAASTTLSTQGGLYTVIFDGTNWIQK